MTALIVQAFIGEKIASAQSLCFTPQEASAHHVRQVQTEMMVAALKCRHHSQELPKQYNSFVTKFNKPLSENAKTLKSFFARAYGKDQSREFDTYITSLANDASLKSMQDPEYCETVKNLFDQALSAKKTEDLHRISSFESSSKAGRCDEDSNNKLYRKF
jgi:hypothetical protein